MAYQVHCKINKLGFSLIELLIVIGIMSLLISVSVSVYSSFKGHENLEIATTGLIEALRYAQSNAQIGKADTDWGAKILSSSVVVFSGSNYASRNTALDQNLVFWGGVATGGISEIVFSKISGSTINTGTITLTNNYGVKNISINEKGTLTY